MPIYVALITMTVVTSAALALSGTLARQLQTTENIIDSERAYYAATSGAEHALYLLVEQNLTGAKDPIHIEGEVSYQDNSSSTYVVDAQLLQNEAFRSFPCIDSKGDFSGNQRRLQLDQVAVDCEF